MITLKEKTTETTLLYIISLLTIRIELKRLLLVLPVRVLLLNTVEIVLSNVRYGYVNRINVVILYNSNIEYDITSYSL